MHLFILIFLYILQCQALGISVNPVKAGDFKKYSSKASPANCVMYPTVKDDLVMVRIKAGDKIPAQKLNLLVFDDDNNELRSEPDISNDISFMFSNLNSPHVTQKTLHQRSNLFNFHKGSKDKEGKDPKDAEKANELINNHKGRSLIYICFDNIYADKSWSFHAQPRNVELFVDIKTMSTITQTNYNNYAQYFDRLKLEDGRKNEGQNGKEVSTDSKSVPPQDFTEDDFKAKMKFLKAELNNAVDSLHNSELILSNLMEQEFQLRDINESIFEGYTKASIFFLLAIAVFGSLQIVFYWAYLKKKKLL